KHEGDGLAVGIEVEAGLDGDDHAGLEDARAAVDAVVADVVDVHADPVPGAVHVELAVVVHGERLVEAAGQGAEREQALGARAASRGRGRRTRARPAPGTRRARAARSAWPRRGTHR